MEKPVKEIRILMIHHRSRDGEKEPVDREAALLQSAGFKVELLERRPGQKKGLRGKLEAARELPYSASARDEVAAKITAYRPKLVHVHDFFPGFTPSIYDACVAAGVPVVQTLHDFRLFCANGRLARGGKPCELCLDGSTLPAVRYACEQGSRAATLAVTRMIRRHRATWNAKVDLFIAPTKFAAQKLAQGGIDPEKIRLKPDFVPSPEVDVAGITESFGLFVGPLREEYGIRTLVQAWEKLKAPLWIVGDGPLRAEAEALKAKNPEVKVLGAMPPDSVARIMARAGYLVVPWEFSEAFPRIVAEGFASGLPVIASRFGALPELVQHERTGLLFEAGNAGNLAGVAGLLAKSTELGRRLGAAARETYLERYTPKVNLRQLAEIYRDVLKSRRGSKSSKSE